MSFYIRMNIWLCLIAIALTATIPIKSNPLETLDRYIWEDVHRTTAEVIRDRGYIAHDHYITTTDGYILHLCQALNPLINNGTQGLPNKDIVFFVHGIDVNAKAYIVNSIGVRPKNYGNHDAGSLSFEKLNELLGSDSNSLVFTALNFGHEVWLIDRRGSTESLGTSFDNPTTNSISDILSGIFRKNPGDLLNNAFNDFGREKISELLNGVDYTQTRDISSSFTELLASTLTALTFHNLNLDNLQNQISPNYWNYSLDEQAQYDFRESIDFILERTGRSKLSVVGHSAGGALILMALADYPEVSDKIANTILWAPALYPLRSTDIKDALSAAMTRINYKGPWTLPLVIPLMRTIIATACLSEISQNILCRPLCDSRCGDGGDQQVLQGQIIAALMDTSSSGEIIQLAYAAKERKMRHYDYLDPDKNMIAYGQDEPPLYDLSKVTARSISLWSGRTDILVTPDSTRRIVADLRVPVEEHSINDTSIYFSHLSFFLHKNVSKLIILPTIKTLARQLN